MEAAWHYYYSRGRHVARAMLDGDRRGAFTGTAATNTREERRLRWRATKAEAAMAYVTDRTKT